MLCSMQWLFILVVNSSEIVHCSHLSIPKTVLKQVKKKIAIIRACLQCATEVTFVHEW